MVNYVGSQVLFPTQEAKLNLFPNGSFLSSEIGGKVIYLFTYTLFCRLQLR